eukprot:CAMPEP_0182863044 /NCGR_PEP_ID=MMETSP0034_2-20130328/6420_1 /TAXON_ID=156128 /ORGANISM="Nephroselmis pyriformis, Strain CCMP717" /LENGTH=39 /DNA_ID= /DNA_START= /DNA_END= /DNA_ORIENTATION=
MRHAFPSAADHSRATEIELNGRYEARRTTSATQRLCGAI